ncbi:hypothetical protein JCM1393_06350 [Clostridium carnis]
MINILKRFDEIEDDFIISTLITIMFLVVFITPDIIRERFLPTRFNYIFIIIYVLLLGILFYKRKIKIYRTRVIFLVAVVVLFTISNILNRSIGNTIYVNIYMCFPLTLLCFTVKENLVKKSLSNVRIIFNTLFYIIIILGIIDYLNNNIVQGILAEKLFVGNYSQLSELAAMEIRWGIYRFYSILGHPLTLARYCFYFMLLNRYCGYKNNYDRVLKLVVVILGIILSGSKMGTGLLMVIFIFDLIFSKDIKNKKRVLGICLISGLIIVNIPIVRDNLVQRFIDGFQKGDIANGRTIVLRELKESDIDIPLILGGGFENSRDIVKQISTNYTNFEYPIIMFTFDYGIIGTIFIYILAFILPSIAIFKKNKLLFIYYLSCILFINTNNAITTFSDAMLQVALIGFMVNTLSQDKIKDKLLI